MCATASEDDGLSFEYEKRPPDSHLFGKHTEIALVLKDPARVSESLFEMIRH